MASPTPTKTKVLFFGTHPLQFNGYSKVVYELSKCLAKKDDIDLTIWGFQNYYKNERHRNDFPANVFVYDAWATEEPKAAGFGIEQIEAYVRENKPDVCIVYNDLLVLTNCMAKIRAAGVPTKIIAYVDQVYLSHKREFIENLNRMADLAIAFTPYWETILKEHGVIIPTGYLQHGFNSDQYYPIPRDVARKYFNLSNDDFIILNANRNQPRKRWDMCIKAFAEVVSRFPGSNIKLLIGTAVTGSWNLIEIYQRELKKRNVNIAEGMRHVIVIDNPQKLTDEEINILYNCADVGITTTLGEGYGLITYEMAGMGIPQIMPRIGGFLDMFNDDNAYMCDPVMSLYQDSAVDGVGGEQLYCDYTDFADGIAFYHQNQETGKQHGAICRELQLTKYRWVDLSDRLHGYVRQVCPPPKTPQQQETPKQSNDQAEQQDDDVKSLTAEVEKIDISAISKLVPGLQAPSPAPSQSQSPATNKDQTKESKTTATKEVSGEATQVGGRRIKSKKKVKNPTAELKKLRKQIDLILNGIESNESE